MSTQIKEKTWTLLCKCGNQWTEDEKLIKDIICRRCYGKQVFNITNKTDLEIENLKWTKLIAKL